jgi:hypothetical protein
MIAYSKKGARAARIKAIELGLKDVFVDFASEEEADKARGYKKHQDLICANTKIH